MLTVSAGKSHIEPIAPGTYPAVCYGLIDLGEQYSERFEKWTRKVLVMWELPGEKIDLGDELPQSRVISQKYTASLNDRAVLRKDLAAWRGRDFTDAELRKFDLKTIVGAPCLLNIIHRDYNGSTYAFVSAVMKLAKGMVTDEPTLPQIVFDLDTDDLSMLDLMPEWVVTQIKASKQYKERTGQIRSVDVDELDIEPDDIDSDNDVPF